MNIKVILAAIDAEKKAIAIHRDKLREIMDDLSGCLESFDSGIEGLEVGKLELESAVDRLSETV